jgi:hypothetical protein
VAHRNGQETLRVNRAEIERMSLAAAVIGECRRELGARSRNIVSEVLAGSPAIVEWQHYPVGEAYDPKNHAQYFYHTHPASGRPVREHGHFHTFLRAEGVPAGTAPLLLPEIAVADVPALPPQAPPIKYGTREEVCHLVAISVDSRGEPIRMFTTNRWVTGETWYRADDVIRMLDCFAITGVGPSETLNRWLSAMLRLFRPQIAALLRMRDETVMAWRRRRRTHVFEDPALEITSSLDIGLDAQLAFLDRVRSEPAARHPRSVRVLPGMAEGWADGHAG